MFEAGWLRSSPWLLAAVGALLEAAATVPFALVELPELSIALAILISAGMAFVLGPRWGLLVAAIGAVLVFIFPGDLDARALAAVPAWLVLAGGAGVIGEHFRDAEREHRLATSEVDAVRSDAAQALVELDLDGRITGWSRGAAEVYGYDAEEVEGEEIAVLTNGAGGEEVTEALELVRDGGRKELDGLHHRRKDGDDAVVSLSLSPITDGSEVVGACALIHDETEQRRLHDIVEEAETKYRVLAEGLPLVTWLSTPEDPTSSIYVSAQIESMLGYSATEWRDDPELFSNVLHPDDRERVLERRTQAGANGGAPSHDEYRLISRAGVVVWVREQTTLLRDARGEPLYLQTFLLDVGERKRAEQDRERLLAAERAAASRTVERQRRLDFLREAGQLLSSLLDHASAIQRVAELAVRDYADWCVVDIVDEGGPLQRLATARGELLKHAAGARPDDEPGAAVHAVVESGAPRIVPALGSSSSGSDDESPRLLGGLEVRSALCVPLRARKRSLGALTLARTESQDVYGADDLALAEDLAARIAVAIDRGHLYREVEQRADAARVLQHVADGVLLLDRNGIVRLWNPAAEAITSIRAEEVVGRPAGEVIPGWRDSVDSVPVSETPDPGHAEVVIPIETEIGERWISISGVEFFGGTVYAFRDLTEIRQLEELKADFIATASHELRTPLAAVYGAAQTLLRHDFALDEGGRDRFVSLIAEESDRLGRIVNEILLANQLEAGRLDLGTEPFEPAEIVERVVEATRAYAPPEISFDVRAEGELPRVAADRDKVRQVLVNLIENAIKYSPDGGRIELGVTGADGHVRFSVKDEGLGIPPEEQSRVFEKFYRLDPQMTRGVGGTGLGLYICHELVGRMGGQIWVEANEDKGSTFLFELPVEETSMRQLPDAIEAQAHRLASRT